MHEFVFQKVSKLHELAIFPLADFKVSNRRFLHLIGYQPIKVLHSLRYLHLISLFLHYVPRFCTLSADQIQEICSCILLESKLWVRSVLFYRFELTDVMRTLITVLIMFPVLIKEQHALNLQGNETSM